MIAWELLLHTIPEAMIVKKYQVELRVILDNGSEICLKGADNEETLKNRLDAYEKNAKPLIEYYKKKGKLKEVDATDTLKYTKDEIKEIIEI